MSKRATNNAKDPDLSHDLVITNTTRRGSVGGTWVTGCVGGHSFQALVFPEHAEVAAYEIGTSRISKLWLQRQADRREVYSWDRGLDRAPVDETAAAIVSFLAEGLADYVFGE